MSKINLVGKTKDYIFISCDNVRDLQGLEPVIINDKVYNFVKDWMLLNQEKIQKIILEKVFFEENWHDKLTKMICCMTDFDKSEVSGAVFAYSQVKLGLGSV